MRSVAEGFVAGMLAVADRDGFFLGEGELLRAETGSLVGTVAERLGLGTTAGTPPVIPGGECHELRFAVENDFWFHSGGITLRPVPAGPRIRGFPRSAICG